MRSISLLALSGAFAATALSAQFPQTPGPDLIVPDGSVDGWYRFVDRNGDGNYTVATGEAYDYELAGFNVSMRKVAYLNGWLYTTGVNIDDIYKSWDANGDGIIDFATESSIAMDSATELTGTFSNPLDIVTDGVSLWIANSSGTEEGIWKFTDLNGDGDFTYALGEITGAAVETGTTGGGMASIPVANAANTPGAVINFFDLQSMSFDPTTTPGSLATGRLLVENEGNNAECTLAFEDINGDGDFYDAGECYIFLNLCNDPARGLYLDASPDLATFAPQYSLPYYEIEHVQVDTTGPTRTWYAISEDSTGSAAELGIVFKCVDANNDGDCNDAGECSVWFDGSGDSLLGATTDYDVITGSGIYNGDLYLAMQRTDGDDEIIALRDLDGSGVIDQPNEVASVHRQRNQTLYNIECFAPGVLPAPPAGNVGYYEYPGTGTCLSTGGGLHNIAVGTTNFDDKPIAGNTLPIRSFGAAPNSPLALHVGTLYAPPIPLDGAATCVLTVDPVFFGAGLSDGTGAYVFGAPISAGLSGFQWYFQWVALDALATPFGVTVSDTVFIQLGDFSFTQE